MVKEITPKDIIYDDSPLVIKESFMLYIVIGGIRE